jgi:hypothetical protein
MIHLPVVQSQCLNELYGFLGWLAIGRDPEKQGRKTRAREDKHRRGWDHQPREGVDFSIKAIHPVEKAVEYPYSWPPEAAVAAAPQGGV